MDLFSNLPDHRPDDVAFVYRGFEISRDENRFINLTEMWKSVGSPPSKKPSEWARQTAGKEFVLSLASVHKVGITHLMKSQKGKGVAGTWAHWQVAVAYAKYLSPEYHRYVNEAFREWAEEKADPDLKARRAVEGYRRQGKSDEWIEKRLAGIVKRHELTDILKEQHVQGEGYAICTDTINKDVTDQTARQLRILRNVPPSGKTRDYLDPYELAAIQFAESVAGFRIKENDVKGNVSCAKVCHVAGMAARVAIDAVRPKTKDGRMNR